MITQRRQLFYEPEQGACGDFMPFHWEGIYYLFYLSGQAELDVSLITTEDFVHVKEHGVVIPRGGESDQDRSIGTGCVYEHGGAFHFLYTGFNAALREEEGRYEQVVMRATSADLLHWTKDSSWRLQPDAAHYYGKEAWRDPHVFRNETDGSLWMILASQAKSGPAANLASSRRTGLGCVALLTSEDGGVAWESREALFRPGLYDALECPDLFRIGDWWYLTFSEYRDLWTMHYRMARSPLGPWLCPPNEQLDVRAFYAAKTAAAGERRMLIGWVARKEGGKDSGTYQWGGSLLAHELAQHPDGTLGLRLPSEIEASFGSALLADDAGDTEAISLDATGSFNYAEVFSELPDAYLAAATVRWEPGTRMCGLLLHASDGLNDGYMVYLEPERGVAKFEKWLRPWDYPAMECRFTPAGGASRIEVMRSGTTIAIYIDGVVAMSARAYELHEGKLGLFASEGKAVFQEVSCKTFA